MKTHILDPRTILSAIALAIVWLLLVAGTGWLLELAAVMEAT